MPIQYGEKPIGTSRDRECSPPNERRTDDGTISLTLAARHSDPYSGADLVLWWSSLALPLPLCPVKPLISGRSVLAGRKAWGWNGSLPTTTNQRDYARLNLWPDRHRIHDGLRHYRHGELRPRRCFHGVEFHSARCLPAARQFYR